MYIALWFMLSLVHAGVLTSAPTSKDCAPKLSARELARSLEQELKTFRQTLASVQVLDEHKFLRWRSEHPSARITTAPVAAFRGSIFSLRYPVLLEQTRRLAELLSVFGDNPQVVNLQHRLMELRDHLREYAAIDDMRRHVILEGLYDEDLANWFEPGSRIEFTDRVKGRVVTSYRELIQWMLAQNWMAFTGKLSTIDIALASVNETWPKPDIIQAHLEDSLNFNVSRLTAELSAAETVDLLQRILQIARIERNELNVTPSLRANIENVLQSKGLPLAKEVRDLALMSDLSRAPAELKAKAKARAEELRGLVRKLFPAQ